MVQEHELCSGTAGVQTSFHPVLSGDFSFSVSEPGWRISLVALPWGGTGGGQVSTGYPLTPYTASLCPCARGLCLVRSTPPSSHLLLGLHTHARESASSAPSLLRQPRLTFCPLAGAALSHPSALKSLSELLGLRQGGSAWPLPPGGSQPPWHVGPLCSPLLPV